MPKRVVVAGGGIAGVEAAIFAAQQGFETVLLSDRDFLFVYPLSIWIPVGKLEFSQACVPLKSIADANGFNVIIDRVVGLDRENNRVLLAQREPERYDYLILATGSTHTPIPGDDTIYSICDAPETSLAMRDAIISLLKNGSGSIAVGFGGNPLDGSGVRGGPAFEIVFNLDTYLKSLGIRDHFNLSFFAPMENPGERLGLKSAAQFAKVLDRSFVRCHFGKKIERFSKQGVHLGDHSVLPADMVFFIPARSGRAEYQGWGLPVSEAGFIDTDEGCRVRGFDNIYAIGDAATLLGPAWRAKQGHVAEVMARTAVHNIKEHSGGRVGEHSYVPHVMIMCLMDTGSRGVLVYRDLKREVLLPLFQPGHLLKQAWGFYYKKTKLRKIPRLPGL